MYGKEDENEVLSFSEYFDHSFVKMSKRIKYDGVTLYKFVDDEVKLNLFPIDRVIKNNISGTEDVLSLIKEHSLEDYETIKKYIDSTSVTLEYKELYKFSYRAILIVNCIELPYRSKYRGFYVNTTSKGMEVVDDEMLVYPKKGFKSTMLKGINLDEVENTCVTSSETKKNIVDLYREIRKQTIKTIERKIKASSINDSYVIRAIRFSDIKLIKCMLPVYYIHCKKPGFDIKYTINANTRKVFK